MLFLVGHHSAIIRQRRFADYLEEEEDNKLHKWCDTVWIDYRTNCRNGVVLYESLI